MLKHIKRTDNNCDNTNLAWYRHFGYRKLWVKADFIAS